MSQERPKPHSTFGFTEREALWDRVSHRRLEAILQDEQTAIHNIHLDSNSFGQFLFVTTSRPVDEGRLALTFFGLGHHEQRDRWLTDEWFWYETTLRDEPATLEKQEALGVIEQRRQEVLSYATGQVQSGRGRLFDVIADLTDDDGAMAEFEDLGELFDDEDY